MLVSNHHGLNSYISRFYEYRKNMDVADESITSERKKFLLNKKLSRDSHKI